MMVAIQSLSTSIYSSSLLWIWKVMVKNPFPAQQEASSPYLPSWSSVPACFSKYPQLCHQEKMCNRLLVKQRVPEDYNFQEETILILPRILDGLKKPKWPTNHRTTLCRLILSKRNWSLWIKFKLSSTKETIVITLKGLKETILRPITMTRRLTLPNSSDSRSKLIATAKKGKPMRRILTVSKTCTSRMVTTISPFSQGLTLRTALRWWETTLALTWTSKRCGQNSRSKSIGLRSIGKHMTKLKNTSTQMWTNQVTILSIQLARTVLHKATCRIRKILFWILWLMLPISLATTINYNMTN